MSSATLYSLVETLITDNWAHCTVRTADSEFDVPATRAAFAELSFPFVDEEQISTGDSGNNLFRNEGGFSFCVFVPVEQDIATWLGRLDTLRSVLRGHSGSSGHFRIYEAPPPAIGQDSEQPGYNKLMIAVPYEFDFYG